MDVSVSILAVCAFLGAALVGVFVAREILRRRRIRQKMAERAAAIARENEGR
jgi:hypothetical protein